MTRWALTPIAGGCTAACTPACAPTSRGQALLLHLRPLHCCHASLTECLHPLTHPQLVLESLKVTRRSQFLHRHGGKAGTQGIPAQLVTMSGFMAPHFQ